MDLTKSSQSHWEIINSEQEKTGQKRSTKNLAWNFPFRFLRIREEVGWEFLEKYWNRHYRKCWCYYEQLEILLKTER